MRGRKRIALLAGVSAILIGGCGSGDEGTIPMDQSDTLLNLLAAVEQSVQEGDCDHAEANALELTAAVNALPDDVDRELRSELTKAAVHLTDLAQDPTQCVAEGGATGLTGTVEPTESDAPTTPTEPETPTSTPEEPTQEEPTEDPNPEPDNGQGQGDQGSPGNSPGNGGTESGGTAAGGGGG